MRLQRVIGIVAVLILWSVATAAHAGAYKNFRAAINESLTLVKSSLSKD